MSKNYEVKLDSGRILGPLDSGRIEALARKNKITGSELARELPAGEWRDINQLPELAEILIRAAAGTRLLRKEGLLPQADSTGSSAAPLAGSSSIPDALPGATHVLERSKGYAPLPEKSRSIQLHGLSDASPGGGQGASESEPTAIAAWGGDSPELATQVAVSTETPEERTQIGTAILQRGPGDGREPSLVLEGATGLSPRDSGTGSASVFDLPLEHPDLSREETIVFAGAAPPKKKDGTPRRFDLRKLLVAGGVLTVAGLWAQENAPELWELFFPSDPAALQRANAWQPLRPALPTFTEKKDPQAALKAYEKGMQFYLRDTVLGYRAASELFKIAAGQDPTNVKALALLASSYLNLIDSSNKDEKYFAVISKLIEMSRAKSIDLAETVIADVEFFLTINKAEAAEKRIVDFTKTQPKIDASMFYYLALAYFNRGDFAAATRYIGLIPVNKAFSAKVFYLRGQIAEKVGEEATARGEYEAALKLNPEHARSHLRLAELLHKAGRLKDAQKNLEFLVENPRALAPKELGLAYYLHCQYSELFQKLDVALSDIERAVKLDRENPDYLLTLYTLRAKAGDSIQAIQKHARMYYFLGEGEKQRRLGKHQEALTQYLMARQADDTSALPPLKIGDMFKALKDSANARINYRIAAERAPNSIEVWSKYIGILIDSYEWEDAQKAMDRFRQLPVSQSAIDKAAADMYAKQEKHAEAQAFYKKAMSRETIDPEVYNAYAKSLMATQNFKDAPFFFALALRFDPLNIDAIVGTARCIAATESVDRAISMLQDELNKTPGARAELLAAIAELQIQRGDWELAETNVKLSMEADGDYAYPWKLLALIYLNQEGSRRGMQEKALAAYQSFSDRNSSDPSGYLERYKLFVRRTQYENASDELKKIYAIYPRYPNLHYFQGQLYSAQGNTQAAMSEFRTEIKNTPGNVPAMLALGKVLLTVGAFNEALQEFSRAMQLAPQASEPKAQAGWTNCLVKNYAAGVALLRSAAQIDRGNALLYKRLGICNREMGDGPAAVQAFRKYIEMEPDAPDRAEFERLIR